MTEIKVILQWTIVFILLTSAAIQILRFLRLKRRIKSFELQRRRLYRSHFGKLLEGSSKEITDCNPPTTRITFTGR